DARRGKCRALEKLVAKAVGTAPDWRRTSALVLFNSKLDRYVAIQNELRRRAASTESTAQGLIVKDAMFGTTGDVPNLYQTLHVNALSWFRHPYEPRDTQQDAVEGALKGFDQLHERLWQTVFDAITNLGKFPLTPRVREGGIYLDSARWDR